MRAKTELIIKVYKWSRGEESNISSGLKNRSIKIKGLNLQQPKWSILKLGRR